MNNLLGITLIVAAMAAFAIEDMFIKLLAGAFPTEQVIFIIGLAGSVVFLVAIAATRERLMMPAAWGPVPLLRATCDGFASVFFITALARVDLSVVAAVFQAVPLFVTLGAALFLGETVGWRRWSAILIGFMGVLLVIRPGTDGFDANTLFVVVTVAIVAVRDLITRYVPQNVGTMTVSLQAFAATGLAGGLLMLFLGTESVAPGGRDYAYIVGAAIFGTVGVYGIVHAMRVAEASAVQPFRYSRLVFSMLVGIVVFAERPDALTYLGSALIIACGLYTFFRERAVARDA